MVLDKRKQLQLSRIHYGPVTVSTLRGLIRAVEEIAHLYMYMYVLVREHMSGKGAKECATPHVARVPSESKLKL